MICLRSTQARMPVTPSVPSRMASPSAIRPTQAPTRSVLHHNGVHISLRTQSWIDLVSERLELLRDIKNKSGRLGVHTVRLILVVDAWKLDRIAERHLRIHDVDDHLKHGVWNGRRSG